MAKVLIESIIKKTHHLKDTVLIGVGPMSHNVIEACFKTASTYNFPLIFIASRNQIDLKKYGGGYVNGWDQFEFAEAIRKIAKKYSFENYYLCRDHGGPWQRDEERNAHLSLDEAMKIAKESFAADIEAGFDLLMIDPTKDPFIRGKVVDINFVLDRTIELIEYCEAVRKKLGIKPISYEVGTEETNGGLTDFETFQYFIQELNKRLDEKNLPRPIYIVGQTGTLVKSTTQAGKFNFDAAKKLSDIAEKEKIFLKEHNADYLDKISLLSHIPAGVSTANVAPQFGTEETRAYIDLYNLEKRLFTQGVIIKPSKLYEVLLLNAIKTNRWKKWITFEQDNLTTEEIIETPKISKEILEIAGHYTFNNDQVKKEIEKLYENLLSVNINGQTFVQSQIETAITEYVNCFNLKQLMQKIK